MSKILRSIALTLSIMIGVSNAVPTYASTISSKDIVELKAEQKSNFVILSNDLSNTVYTYDEGGKSYKVEESANYQLDKVFSEVYIKDESNNYIFDHSIETSIDIDKGISTIVTTKDNKQNIEFVDLGVQNVQSQIPSLYSHEIGGGGIGTTPFKYVKTSKGSTNFTKYTLVGITAAVTYVITIPAGVASGAIATAAGAIANAIISDNIKSAYWSTDIYASYFLNSNVYAADQWKTQYYKDSSRTKKVGPLATDTRTR